MPRTPIESENFVTFFGPFAPHQALRMSQPVVICLADLNGRAMTSCLELNREWTGFLIGRVQQDMSLVHDLARCTNPSDAFSICSAFYSKALSDYRAEFAKLATLNGKGFEQTTQALRDTVENARAMSAAA